MPTRKATPDWKGSFRHYRAQDEAGNVSSSGGATISFTEIDGRIFAAVAYSHPNDNFSYQYGRAKADGRLTQLLKRPELDDEDIYFVRETTVDDFFRIFDAFMADDMEYIPNGKKKQKAASA